MISHGNIPLNSVIPFVFDSFDGGTGASITLTGLALGDIRIYKGISMTIRSSTAGVVLMDTDGIDIDTTTGIHGFSIDTSDNTDAGFYAAGSFYWVVIESVTIDAQTVNFVAGTFRLTAAEGVAGVPDVNVTHVADTAQTAGDLKASLNTIDDFLDTEIATLVGYGAPPTAAVIADAVLDEDMTAHQTLGTLGQAIGDPVADTNTIYKAVVTDATGATVGLDVVALKAETVLILEDTGTTLQAEVDGLQATLGVAGAGLTDLGGMSTAMKAQVNVEALDVLNTDTFAEPGQEAPGATVSLVKKISYLYKAFRNKITQTSTTLSLFADDAATVDQKATVSDDATTYTRGEIGTGP